MLRILFPLALLLAALPAQAFDACSTADRKAYRSVTQRSDNAVLYRIVRCGRAPSHLLGTIHSDDPRVTELARPIMPLVKAAQLAAFEYVAAPEQAATITARYMFTPQGQRGLEDYLETAELRLLTSTLQQRQQFSPSVVQRLKPWAAAVMLQFPPSIGDGVVLDDRLRNFAEENGIELLGLETMESQFQLFDKLPRETQLVMLRDALANLDQIEAMNRQLHDIYLREDLQGIYRLGVDSFAEITDPALRRFMEEAVLYDRNRKMASSMQDALKRGNAFVAIGALHLPSERGVLRLLERAGYFVLPVRLAPQG